MKVLITGANGFIGSYMCDYFLNNNCEVIGLSRRFFPKVREKLKNATLIEVDILSENFSSLKLEADIIVHLAASNDIVSRDLARGIELSTLGTVNTLKFAQNNGIRNYIFFSTLQVYGTELKGKYSEDTIVKPENDYAMNHLFGEMYVEMYSRKFDINAVVARPSNIYGSFLTNEIERWTLVPGCFCKEAIEKGTITLMSSGKQNRNFISLEQLSYCTLQTASNIHKKFDIINYVTNDYNTIFEIAKMTQKIFNEKFDKKIELKIGSDMPDTKNDFEFKNSKFEKYKIEANQTNSTHTLETEILKVIQDLIKIN
jgi:UDP-glucose 4-epimerase